MRSFDRTYKAYSLYLMPEARYSFLSGRFRPYVYGNAGIGFGSANSLYPQYISTLFKAETGVGFSCFITDRFALEARLGIGGVISG